MVSGMAQAYIKEWNKTDRAITLHNGAVIWFGGARTAEKFRGRYLDGVVIDERSQIPDHILNDILYFCLLDRNGWMAVCGTARSDDDYKLYKGFQEASKQNSGYDLVMKIGVNESNVLQEHYNINPAQEKEKYISQAIADGATPKQAEQSWLCEMECDFSFIDEGRPNMNALFYTDLDDLHNSEPARLTAVPATQDQTAILDLSSGGGGDYTSAAVLNDQNNVTALLWANNKTLTEWGEHLLQLGVRTAVLPFDAKVRWRDTGLTAIDIFERAGFTCSAVGDDVAFAPV